MSQVNFNIYFFFISISYKSIGLKLTGQQCFRYNLEFKGDLCITVVGITSASYSVLYFIKVVTFKQMRVPKIKCYTFQVTEIRIPSEIDIEQIAQKVARIARCVLQAGTNKSTPFIGEPECAMRHHQTDCWCWFKCYTKSRR